MHTQYHTSTFILVFQSLNKLILDLKRVNILDSDSTTGRSPLKQPLLEILHSDFPKKYRYRVTSHVHFFLYVIL